MAETVNRAAVTRAEAAAMYGVGEKVITQAIHSGALPAKLVSRRYRIGVGDLAAWFASLPDA